MWRGRGSPRLLAVTSLLLLLSLVAGCNRPEANMRKQPKVVPLQPSEFFEDGRSARPLVDGAIPQDLPADEHLLTGAINGQAADSFPAGFPTHGPELERKLRRGQERFDIFCSPCHGRIGDGDGMIVQRGFTRPPSLHEQRLQDAPVGHFYQVITNGYRAMYSQGQRVPVDDRWAIAAYIRALQLSQNPPAAATRPATQERGTP